MRWFLLTAVIVVFLNLLIGCQFTYSYVDTTNFIAEGATVQESTQSGDIDPAVSRGGNTVTPSTSLDFTPGAFGP